MARVKKNPDKWIRQAVSNRVDGIVVSGATIYVVDTNYTGETQPRQYIALSTQTKRDDQIAKCGWEWECSILLDIVTRYIGTGNTGSRDFVNDIEEQVISLMNDLTINGGFRVDEIVIEDSTSMDGNTDTEVYFRQLLRYRIHLTEETT